MVNVNNIQRRIDKLMSVFTNLITALDNAIKELKGGIRSNNVRIEQLKNENEMYANKITEYEGLMASINGIVKHVNKVGD